MTLQERLLNLTWTSVLSSENPYSVQIITTSSQTYHQAIIDINPNEESQEFQLNTNKHKLELETKSFSFLCYTNLLLKILKVKVIRDTFSSNINNSVGASLSLVFWAVRETEISRLLKHLYQSSLSLTTKVTLT